MLRTILWFVIVLVAVNYLVMGVMVLLGNSLGWESECNPIYCKFTKGDGEVLTHCTRNGIPINCSYIEDKYNLSG